MNRVQLCWLRNDLRSHDNKALSRAREQGPVVAVWLVSEQTWREHLDAPVKIDFWLRNLASLQQRLQQRGIPLRILHCPRWQDAADCLLQLAGELQAAGLHFNAEYGIHEQQRDDACLIAFRQAGLQADSYHDQLLFPPGSLLTRSGSMFKVYSQFRKLAIATLHQRLPRCLAEPEPQPPLAISSDAIPQLPGLADASALQQQLWPAGEAAAQQRLQQFCEDSLHAYSEQRDRPDLDGTSRLSPYLASGVISVRQCLHAAMRCNQGELDSGNRGVQTWVNELLWREFYKHILVAYPHVSRHRAFRPETEAVAWRNDPKALEAWQQGRTGYPIIDAAMRQLLATGWMHNRLRMLSAMFLTKNLLIDWREGERWFMQHLIDGDLAANNGGWQWSASTGTDAAPYFRIFNPVTQAQKFDPDGDFIRQWLPELASRPTRLIHQPLPAADLFGTSDYPPPLVELSASRQRALDAFKNLGETQ